MSEYKDQFGITWEYEIVESINGWSIKWGKNDLQQTTSGDIEPFFNFVCE